MIAPIKHFLIFLLPFLTLTEPTLLFSSPGHGSNIIPHARSIEAGRHFLNVAKNLFAERARESASLALELALNTNLDVSHQEEALQMQTSIQQLRHETFMFFQSVARNERKARQTELATWLHVCAHLLQMGEQRKGSTLLKKAAAKWTASWETTVQRVAPAVEGGHEDTTRLLQQLGTLARQGVWLAQTSCERAHYA